MRRPRPGGMNRLGLISWQDDIGPAGPHRIEALERVVFGHTGLGLLDFFIIRTPMFRYKFWVEGDRIVLRSGMWPFFCVLFLAISLVGMVVAISVIPAEPAFPIETLGILLVISVTWPIVTGPGRFMHCRYRDAARNAMSSFPDA